MSCFVCGNMAPITRKVQPKKYTPEKPPVLTNAERCKLYRENLKADPVRFEIQKAKDLVRWKKDRDRPLTESEIADKREKSRIRSKLYRDRKKAEKAEREEPKEKTTSTGTRSMIAKRKEKFREQKAKERAGWSAQKWRRHRESCQRYYYKKKEEKMSMASGTVSPSNDVELPADGITLTDSATTPQRSLTSKERKAMSRAKKQVNSLGPLAIKKLLTFLTDKCKDKPLTDSILAKSPSPRKVKSMIKERVVELSKKRSKTSIASKRLLEQFVSAGDETSQCGIDDLYKRKKPHPGTKSALQFLEDAATDLPGKRTVSKRLLKQKKILPKRFKELFRDFNSQTDHSVSIRTMYRRKPKHILTSRRQSYLQCLCEICTNVDLKLDAINPFLKGTSVGEIVGRDAISEMSLCKDLRLDCVERNCHKCGIDGVSKLLFNSISVDKQTEVIQWKTWEFVIREKDKIKRKEIVRKFSTVKELLQLLLKDLKDFSKHLFVFRWQYRQLSELKAALPLHWVIAIFDFAENFLCKNQDEVQSAHWSYNQVTLHPCVLYYHCNCCSELVTDYLVYMSDDLNHDASFVKCVTTKMKQYLQSVVLHIDRLVIFSDGCSSQYKSKLPFFHLTQEMGVPLERCFFGSRHGKSSCDACGGVVKRLVDDDVKSRKVDIQCAEAMVQHCSSHHAINESTAADPHLHTRRSFHLVKTEEIDRTVKSSDVTTILGTRKIHSIKKADNSHLFTRSLSCFCKKCVEGSFESCMNSKFVDTWKIVKLRHSVEDVLNNAFLDCDEDDMTVGLEEEDNSLPTDREGFFTEIYQQLSVCDSLQSLITVVKKCAPLLKKFPLPQVKAKSVLEVKGSIDKNAQKLVPSGFGCGLLFPVLITSDGNCVPRSISLGVFGSEELHVEVRCRIVFELAEHADEYIASLDPERTQILCQSSNNYCETVEETFVKELLDVKSVGTFMGLWQLMAAANVFGVTIASVYPEKGVACHRDLYNRVLHPRSSIPSSGTITLLWTSTRDLPDPYWTANHVVILLPINGEVVVEAL